MVEAKCVKIERGKNNQIKGYHLLTKNGATKYIEKEKLKEQIKDGKIQVENLTLTSDNRIVAKEKWRVESKYIYRGIKNNGSTQNTGGITIKDLLKMNSVLGLNTVVNGVEYGTFDGHIIAKAFDGFVPKECILHNGVEIIPFKAFEGCKNLKYVWLPNSVTRIRGWAFHMCTGLIEIEIPDSVLNIGREAFMECTHLTSIELPRGIPQIAQGTFFGCSRLQSIEIHEGVTEIGVHAFTACKNLMSVVLPHGLLSIGDEAFWGCHSLTSIQIPKSVRRMGNSVFKDCSRLQHVKLPAQFMGVERWLGICRDAEIEYC